MPETTDPELKTPTKPLPLLPIAVHFNHRGGHFNQMESAKEAEARITAFLEFGRLFAPKIEGYYEFHFTQRTKRSGSTPTLDAFAQPVQNPIHLNVEEGGKRFDACLQVKNGQADLLHPHLGELCQLVSTEVYCDGRLARKLQFELHRRVQALKLSELDQLGLELVLKDATLTLPYVHGGTLELNRKHLLILLDFFARHKNGVEKTSADGYCIRLPEVETVTELDLFSALTKDELELQLMLENERISAERVRLDALQAETAKRKIAYEEFKKQQDISLQAFQKTLSVRDALHAELEKQENSLADELVKQVLQDARTLGLSPEKLLERLALKVQEQTSRSD